MTDQRRRRHPAEFRVARLWQAADRTGVPLRTILVTALVLCGCYLGAKLAYRLRDVLLLLIVAGFIALLLNPVVLLVQRFTRRRGSAVTLVFVAALLAFLGLSVAFGYPLATAITRLADKLPGYVASATHGRGWIGHLVIKYHVEQWVTQNAPKLVTFGQDLTAPALAFGKGAVSLLLELTTIFMTVLLLLLEGPKLRRGILGLFSPETAEQFRAIASEVNRAVVGYMFGNFLTSLICGLVVFVTLLSVGVPFAGLWALWVALVDFLPMIGGALAGIPTVLFAAAHSVPAGLVTLIAFVTYTQIENHVLSPIVMSKTVRISPLLVLVAVLVGASVGSWTGGLFGGFVAALLAIPAAGALQVIVREAWRISGPPAGTDKDADEDAGEPDSSGTRSPASPPYVA